MFHSCAVPLRDNYWIHYFTYLQYTCWLSTPFSHWSITSFHTCCIILPRVTITLYRSFASFVYFWFYLTHAKVRLRWCYLYSRTYKGTIHISLLMFLCLKLINQSSLFDVVYSKLQIKMFVFNLLWRDMDVCNYHLSFEQPIFWIPCNSQ